MVGGAVGRHRTMHTRTSLVFAKDSGREEKTPLLHSLRSAVLVCLDTTRFVRDGMTVCCCEGTTIIIDGGHSRRRAFATAGIRDG